jgi:hypothetical protein
MGHHHEMRLAHIHQSMCRHHGTACVNMMESHIASSAQRDQLSPVTLVQRRSWWGLTCTSGGTSRVGNPWPSTTHKQRWTIGKMSRLAANAPLGEGIAQLVIEIYKTIVNVLYHLI